MRLFAQLSWYFRREWRRYLGAVALLVIIAMLQLVPPKVVGIVVDGVTEQHFTTGQILMWIATMVLIAVVVYLLRYVWRVLLFGASYQLAVELREDYYRQLSRQHPEFYLRHRTGDLMARATNDVDRVVERYDTDETFFLVGNGHCEKVVFAHFLGDVLFVFGR